MHKDQAQQRVDRIRAFRDELTQLEGEGVLTLPPELRAPVDAHHNRLLRELTRQYDVDVSGADKQLSLGMRIVSLLGALALSAAVFFFFYRFWGGLGTTVQVAVLVVAPLLATASVELAARREPTLYFASLLALVAFACFVLNLVLLGAIFNITPSQNAFLVWGAFALLLAYGYGLRLLQVAGMCSLTGYLAATIGTFGGCYWLSFGERPENFIAAGALLALVPLLPQRKHPHFAGYYRVFGLLCIFIAILILANWGSISYLPWAMNTIESLYQTAGFLLAAAAIALGIRQGWPGVVNLGSTFFVLYLYTKFFDWWWEWMPKYLFFLLLGLIAVGLLLAMRRLRSTMREVMP
ncbi:MAG: hypothetical protein A2091_07340 [Desulfuromonadales bacterium GWD2_61_12]|nr:MAG: hypothetical protein A2005_06915 [Desulfuromonadales bacterium GWC2_61_20]OGR36341.1 MAG: hypothetical protein A2091_07340 [Desulfuromonadales bacterium GWD2_61_12]HAD05198.1 DUF2157 domain-containing protein [Desulfuromonas sp.]HBT82958.1 DUF2157 domain-containing protein [Desulfuromonas sp.]